MSKTESTHMLESGAISAFCDSIAAMLSAGIQVEEALSILAESSADRAFVGMCEEAHRLVARGLSLSEALEKTGAFPAHVVGSIMTGEESGRTEEVLRGLAVYYSEESRLFSKMRRSIGYPASLFCIMAIIIAFTIAFVLPVFTEVYEGFAGSLTAGSFAFVGLSQVIGWVALVVTLIGAVVCIALSLCSHSEKGRLRLISMFEAFPLTEHAMYKLALSRFTSAYATYVVAGANTDDAMSYSLPLVENKQLKKKLTQVYADMIDERNPRSVSQAIYENNVFETAYSRMLTIGVKSGNLVEVLNSLSETFFDDAVAQIDKSIDNIEPLMAAFMTLAIGATLVAVMLPLIGIMGSLG